MSILSKEVCMTDDDIRKKAKDILEKNTFSGYSNNYKANFHYMRPGPGTYPYQYFWDTCFHTYTMTALGMSDMAKKCMKSLFAMQEEDGFVGHMLYWKKYLPSRITDVFQGRPYIRNFFYPHMTALIQPPLAAEAVFRIYNSDKDLNFIKEMYPKLKQFYKAVEKYRVFEDNGLLSIITYFESGMDWKPSYDEVIGFKGKGNALLFSKVALIDFRNFINNYNVKKIYQKNYFIVKDVGINTIYAQNLKAMAALANVVSPEDADGYEKKSNKVISSIIQLMYDEEHQAFFDLYGKDNEKLKTLTPTIFFPLVFNEVSEETGKAVIERHLLNKNEFSLPFPIPSVAMNDPAFNPKESLYIWRGPTWVVYNWFLHQSLIERGYRKEATQLVETIKDLISKGGFREYYNPFTGEGYGAQDFTWSTLVVDMMKMEEEKNINSNS